MPYIKEICVAGRILEVRKYHTLRYNCKGEKREGRYRQTCECQQRVNQRKAERTLRRLMNTNFTDNTGMLVTFTYFPRNRPKDSKQMQVDMRNCLKKMRKIFKDKGILLKYIYVKELGKRGAAHIHMMMSICTPQELKQCWTKGGIDMKPLYSKGDYKGIARYFIKAALKTEETEGQLIGKRWNPSRNLKQPVVIKQVVRSSTFNHGIRPKKGYILNPDSVREGYTEAGFKYFSYTMYKEEGGG